MADFCRPVVPVNEALTGRYHCLAAFAFVDEPALRGRVSAKTIMDLLATPSVLSLPSGIIKLLMCRSSVGRHRITSGGSSLLPVRCVDVVFRVFSLLLELDELLVPASDVPTIQLRLVQPAILLLVVFWAARLGSFQTMHPRQLTEQGVTAA